MQFSNELLQTLRKSKKMSQLGRAKSCDNFGFTELLPTDVKVLLTGCLNDAPTPNQFDIVIAKQQLLANKRLFDPFKYFGSPSFITIDEAFNFHSPRLQIMFAGNDPLTERKTAKKITLKGSLGHRYEEYSPVPRGKTSQVKMQAKAQQKRTVGRSPKNYVKQNKQNFQRLNLNSMQKVRVKLKLGKKQPQK